MSRDRGATSIYFVVLAVSVIFAAGLALDGGRKLAATVEVREIADNAARACAQQIDPASIMGGGIPTIDPDTGPSAAQGFAAAAGASASASVAGTTCTVNASMSVTFYLLPGGATVSAQGFADAIDK